MAGPGRELERRRELASKCRSCGTCHSVCPVFAEVRVESSAARGKVALVKAILDGDVDPSRTFDDRLQLCLNCKACVANCPNGVQVDDLVLAARSGLVEAGRLPFVKRVAFRFLLRRGRLLPPFGRLGSFFQRVLLRGLPENSVYRRLLPIVGMDRDRVLPEFAPRALTRSVPEHNPAAGGSPARLDGEGRTRRIGFFVGCATNLIYPETGRAIVRTLTRAGFDVIVPRRQVCCGTPVFNSGDYVTARELARKNIQVFGRADVEAVIVCCASGGLALKREYDETLGIDGGFGIPVYDFSEFLAREGLLGLRDANGPRSDDVPVDADAEKADADASTTAGVRGRLRVTYHEPCHLVRGQGITEEPRELIRSLPWVEFVEMRDSDRCCGGGGSFTFMHYDVASLVGERKAECIRETDADVVVTECPSCVMQLRDMVARYGIDVEVIALADLLALHDKIAEGSAAGTTPARSEHAGARE